MNRTLPVRRGDAAQLLAEFVVTRTFATIPARVIDKAKQLMLDCSGVAYASASQEFAQAALRGLAKFGAGSTAVIGMRRSLTLRDGALLNALLVHGLDFDDTHMEGIIHASASCFPCALAMAVETGSTGQEMLAAYVIGLEVASRLSIVAAGRMHKRGFHPTGLIGAFACSLIAGKLLGLPPRQLVMAQGIALSLAAGGSQEFLQEGAWTKRLHPGWGAAAGMTAAVMASEGFVGPTAVYDGRYGLYALYLEETSSERLASTIADLGERWRTEEIAIKPFPVCHYSHGVVEAAIALSAQGGFDTREIAAIEVFLPAATHHIVCEPLEIKQRPANDYDARFSAPFGAAVGLARGKLGLAELGPETREDPIILELMSKVRCLNEENSSFPKYFSGGIAVALTDGRRIERREMINRGCPDRPLESEELWAKFRANAALSLSADEAEAAGRLIFRAEQVSPAALASFLSDSRGSNSSGVRET
jgi:2-methylcitrate dehydratase PrpD